MKIILIDAYENGARPALQDWNNATPPEGYAWCPDEFVEVFYSTDPAGFVNIEIDGDTVVHMTVNTDALEAYIASLPDEPEDEPTVDDGELTVSDMANAIREGVNEV